MLSRSPVALQDLETQLAKAKEDLTTAGLRLRAMIRAFKENQLYVTPLPTGETEQGKSGRPLYTLHTQYIYITDDNVYVICKEWLCRLRVVSTLPVDCLGEVMTLKLKFLYLLDLYICKYL